MMKKPDGAENTVGILPGTVLGAVLTGVKFTADMLETTNYIVTVQEQNAGTPYEKRRVVIQVESSDYLANKQGMEPGQVYSWNEKGRNSRTGAQVPDGVPEAMYEKVTGEKAKAGKHYDILYSANEEYINNPYMGTVSFDLDGSMTITPYTACYNAILVETDNSTGEQRKIDLTKH